jgi:F0F1-type ATP synthase assembly protein I
MLSVRFLWGATDQSVKDNSGDSRSRQAVAYHWASQVTSVAMEMVLPGLAGYWLDQKLGTVMLFMLIGFAGGLTLGIRHLLKLTQTPAKNDRVGERPSDKD